MSAAPAPEGTLPAPVGALVAALPSLTVADLLPGVPTRDPTGAPLGGPSGAVAGETRAAAVLVLLSGGPPSGDDGADGGPAGPGLRVVLIERSARGVHGGQAAFPGGGTEPGDGSPVATALREAAEEVRLDPASVTVLGVLPALPVPVSRYLVTPVLAWQAQPSALAVGDPAEVVAVHRVPLAVLADPAHRVRVRGPALQAGAPGGAGGGAPAGPVRRWTGPGFVVDGLLVWGFTALLLDALLRTAGLERAWDSGPRGPLVDAPATARSAP